MNKPKLEVKPTPLQTRLLLVLYRFPGMAIRDKSRYNRLVDLRATHEDAREAFALMGGNPKLSTIKSCVKEGWIGPPFSWSNELDLTPLGTETATKLNNEDMIQVPKAGYTARAIVEILRKQHPKTDWVFAAEVRLSSGYGNTRYHLQGHEHSIHGEQRIDAFAMHCWPSKKFKRIGYEIKISRNDFLNEIKKPDKRMATELFTNLAYFVAPAGLIKPDEIPDSWGLIEVSGDMTTIVTDAVWRDVGRELPLSFVASLGRSLSYE